MLTIRCTKISIIFLAEKVAWLYTIASPRKVDSVPALLKTHCKSLCEISMTHYPTRAVIWSLLCLLII